LICLIKVLLLSLKIPDKLFHKFGLFHHGAMDQDEYVEKIWKLHFIDNKKNYSISETKTFLEIGPGDSIQSAFKAKDACFKLTYAWDRIFQQAVNSLD